MITSTAKVYSFGRRASSNLESLKSDADCAPSIEKELEYARSDEFQELQGEFVLAAAHVEDARTGRGSYGKAKYYFKPRHAQIAFKMITSQWFQRIIYITVLVHSALTFLEPPSSQPQSVETYVAIGLNLVCLLLYLTDVILNMVFLSAKVFWFVDEFSWNRVEFVFLCGFTIDWIILIAETASGNEQIVQPFRCLRLAMLMCKARNVGHIFDVVKSITTKMGGILMFVATFILVYSCIGVHLVMRPYENINIISLQKEEIQLFPSGNESNTSIPLCLSFLGNLSETESEFDVYEGAYNHIGSGVLRLFVLLTTENYPTFMFPAFLESEWYFTYFGLFLFFGVFFLTAILIAHITEVYWEYNKKHVKKERHRQRAELVKAWKLLDTKGQEKLPVDDPNFLDLFRILKPKNTDEENMELISELDPEGSGYVSWIQWVTQLLSVLDLEKTQHQEAQTSKFDGPRLLTLAREIAKKITALAYFEKMVLLLIILHSILFAVKWSKMPFEADVTVQAVKTAIVVIFMVEMFLRICATGTAFFKSYLETMDFALVVVGFTANLVWYGSLHPRTTIDVYMWRGWSVVLSCLAIFCRLFFNSSQSRRAMLLFIRLFPVMWDLIVLFAIVMYLYAVIGMEAFHRYNLQPGAAPDHIYYGCGLGFRNFKCSLYVLFQIVTSSNWHHIMNEVLINLGTYFPSIYFISFYIVMDLIFTNLLIGIGIKAFKQFRKDDKQNSTSEDSEENLIPDEGVNHWSEMVTLSQKRKGLKFFHNTAAALSSLLSSTRQSRVSADEEMAAGDPSTEERHSSQESLKEMSSYSGTKQGSSLRQFSTQSSMHVMESITEEGGMKGESFDDDDVFCGSTSNPPNESKVESKATVHLKSNHKQKVMKLLREKRNQRRLNKQVTFVKTTASIDSSNSIPEDDCAQHASDKNPETGGRKLKGGKNWISATHAITFINNAASRASSNKVAPMGLCQEESYNELPPQVDHSSRLKTRRGSLSNGKKFRRGFNHENWRAHVQNMTIINKEEISQLRRQLAMSHGRASFRQNSVTSTGSGSSRKDSLDRIPSGHHRTLTITDIENHNEAPTAETGYFGRRRSSSLSSDHELFLQSRQQSSVSSTDHNREATPPSPFHVCESAPKQQVDSDQPTKSRRKFSVCFNPEVTVIERRKSIVSTDEGPLEPSPTRRSHTPLISMEEEFCIEQEDEASSTSSNEDHDSHTIPLSSKEEKGKWRASGGGRPKGKKFEEIPEWAVKLTQQYHVVIHTSTIAESKP